MRIGLFGYGKMGREIEKIALERGHSITAIVNRQHVKEKVNREDVDIVIEFSAPELAESHIRFCLENNLPVVIGTTGWYTHLDQLSELCNSKQGTMLHATNFSLGVNIFFALNSYLAKIMNQFPEYSASMVEIHHTQKLDAPSGTAITLANQVIAEHHAYQKWENVKKSQTQSPVALSIESLRLPNVPGTHEVKYDSDIDSIELRHTAHSRKGFALGSVLAAEWVMNKKERHGVFTMKDVLNF